MSEFEKLKQAIDEGKMINLIEGDKGEIWFHSSEAYRTDVDMVAASTCVDLKKDIVTIHASTICLSKNTITLDE